jgi:DNA-directed RNA polymerase specialized sigma24 family protein
MATITCPPGLDGLERAASRLSPIEREVLILSARDRLRTHEIADRLGISAEAAERYLVDALCGLDRHLQRHERSWWRFW